MMHFSNKIRLTILIITAALLLGSCKGAPTATRCSPRQIAEAVILSQDNISDLQPLLPGDGYFTEYFSDIYGIKSSPVVDGAIYYADGMLADEIAFFLLADGAAAASIKNTLDQYRERRLDAFTGYAPAQAAILERGIVIARGNWAALLICENPQAAEAAFLACFGDNPPEIADTITETPAPDSEYSESEFTEAGESEFTETGETVITESDETDPVKAHEPDTEAAAKEPKVPDNIPDVFDAAALLEAWESGDKSSLSPKNIRVLDACEEILDRLIDDDMSDYQKELAIHDWIIDRADYDREANNNAPDAKPDPDNDNPYGLIFRKKAICMGYTAAFQLFMDMLGIECISVKGVSQNTGVEHAWNMVRINGEWYCVDVTWNDYFGEDRDDSKSHRYFNVTGRYMRETKHQWDESATPTADASKLYIE